MPVKRVFIAGHRGMVGSALLRAMEDNADIQLVCASRDQLDLLDQRAVFAFLRESAFDQVYVAAARVGGIHANNTYPADFIYENLTIQNNLIYGAFQAGVRQLLFLGSSCIYPKHSQQPISEDALLGGVLEPTNEPYAIAKIAGIKLCESLNRQHGVDFRSLMPTNLYGINDNFHPHNSHVIPALMQRFHDAATNHDDHVLVWGTGNACREFLCVDDMAAASLFVMQQERAALDALTSPALSHLNVGTGQDVSIGELARTMARVTGFEGEIRFDSSKPDGTPRKLLDVSKLARLGWHATIPLEQGLRDTYRWFRQELAQGDQLRSG